MQTLKQSNDLIFKTYRGEEISQIIEPLAQLRMKVFYEYPYLYDGNLDSELRYLGRYLKIKDSFVLMVFDGNHNYECLYYEC